MSEFFDALRVFGEQASRLIGNGSTNEDAYSVIRQKIVEAVRLTGAGYTATNWEKIRLALLFRAGPELGLAWHMNSFASIIVEGRLAASLMTTSINQETAKDVSLPFNCFLVSAPEICRASALVYSRDGKALSVTTIDESDTGVMGSMSAMSLGDLLREDIINNTPVSRLGENDTSDTEILRQEILLARLIVGACIEMDNPKYKKQIQKGPSRLLRIVRGRRGPPKKWVFSVTRPVKLDLRDRVAAFMGGKTGGRLSLQHLVRGHHKRQVFGAGRSDRKWIHIEPYWRGDPDAPIAMRDHAIK